MQTLVVIHPPRRLAWCVIAGRAALLSVVWVLRLVLSCIVALSALAAVLVIVPGVALVCVLAAVAWLLKP